MRKYNLHMMMGILVIILITSIAMNKRIEFTIYACLGFVIMLGITFLNCRKLWNHPNVFAGIMGILLFVAIILGICGIVEIIVISAAAICTIVLRKEWYKKTSITLVVMLGMLAAMNVLGVIILVSNHSKSINAFFTGSGEASYIYDTIGMLLKGSNFWGRSVENSEIIFYLPRYTDACVITNYIASYGWLPGMAVVVLLLCFLGKIIFDMRRIDGFSGIIGMGCATVLMIEMLVSVFENFLLMPFTVYKAFVPCYSGNIKNVLISYVLLGMVMHIYKR